MKKTAGRKIRSHRPLGSLEFEVMRVLWEKGEATGKEVWKEINALRKTALTTVLTVIERLSNKGLVEKTKTEGPFIYRPVLTGEEFTRRALGRMLKDYMRVSTTSLLTSFLDALTETDPDGIERLSEFIKKKRRELRQE